MNKEYEWTSYKRNANNPTNINMINIINNQRKIN